MELLAHKLELKQKPFSGNHSGSEHIAEDNKNDADKWSMTREGSQPWLTHTGKECS